MQKVNKPKRIKLSERTLENDIKFKGVLSYRHLRILGWIFLAIAQIAVVLTFNTKVNPYAAAQSKAWANFFELFTSVPLPLFMIANIASIMQKKDDYKRLLLFYGGMAFGMYLLENFLVFHYGFRAMNSISPTTWGETSDIFGMLLPLMGQSSYAMNIFIDLFLCSLMFFFVNYTPKKYFQGKKIIIFRLFTLIPFIYEIASVIIKYNVTFVNFTIPSYVFFLLTSKPPFLLLAFLIIIVILKGYEHLSIKSGKKDKKFFIEHQKTNAHTLSVSIVMSVVFLIVAIIDFLVTILVTYLAATHHQVEPKQLIDTMLGIGLGGSLLMIPIIPLILLFSYKKTHTNSQMDMIVPLVGVGLIVLVYVEGMFEVITINMPYMLAKLKDIFSGGGDEPPPDPGIINSISNIIRSIRIF